MINVNLKKEHLDMDPNSQQFATVTFQRGEDEDECTITVTKHNYGGNETKVMRGDNKYNLSLRRTSSAVYVANEDNWYVEEDSDEVLLTDLADVTKISILQHKGFTLVESAKVEKDELKYLFG